MKIENGELKIKTIVRDELRIEMGNVIVEKSFEFAVDIVKLSKELMKGSGDYELASQLIRSGTSIGANVSEAQEAQSKKDFISKMNISLKEASETKYWLSLLSAVGIISQEKYLVLSNNLDEIIRLLISIIKSSKEKA